MLITGDTTAQVEHAKKIVGELIVVIDDERNEHKQNQLRELAIMNGTVKKWRESLYYAYYEFGEHAVPQHFGVRSMTHKLFFFPATNEWNMFDLTNDPQEGTQPPLPICHNLFRNPTSSASTKTHWCHFPTRGNDALHQPQKPPNVKLTRTLKH